MKTSDKGIRNNEKTCVSKESLFAIINMIDSITVPYTIEGGWGVDILNGRQTRKHHDLDIDIDKKYMNKMISHFKQAGFEVTDDKNSARIEMYHKNYGYVDIHPLEFASGGSAKQFIPGLGEFIFKKDWFVTSFYDGKQFNCFSCETQILFHSGYELRDIDKKDLEVLKKILVRSNNK